MRRRRFTTAGAAIVSFVAAFVLSAALPAGAAPAVVGELVGGSEDPSTPVLPRLDTLRWAAPPGFVVGTAVAGGGHHRRQGYPDPFTHDAEYRRHLGSEFSSLTPENQLKWQVVQPRRGVYDFAPADAIVAFAGLHGQVVRGHTLLWHRQNPAWLEQGRFSRDELRGILREHILTVVGRYAGRIGQWDVANEIFDDAGRLRTDTNLWLRELGPGIIADAFRWAHQADPTAQLFLTDYGVEGVNAKSDAYHRLARHLLARGVPVHGFGTQGHYTLHTRFDRSLQANLQRFDDLGLATAITEVDVRMRLRGGAPTPRHLRAQAARYHGALQACLAVAGCRSFTVWGVPDRYSWVPSSFPGEGAATILWDDYRRKPAYHALHRGLAEASRVPAVRLPSGVGS